MLGIAKAKSPPLSRNSEGVRASSSKITLLDMDLSPRLADWRRCPLRRADFFIAAALFIAAITVRRPLISRGGITAVADCTTWIAAYKLTATAEPPGSRHKANCLGSRHSEAPPSKLNPSPSADRSITTGVNVNRNV